MHDFVVPFSSLLTSPTLPSPLSLHDALPISPMCSSRATSSGTARGTRNSTTLATMASIVVELRVPRAVPELVRSEEHTSELQSHHDLVCRLLLEKKKNTKKKQHV